MAATPYSEELVQKICALIEQDDYRTSELARMAGISTVQFNKWIAEKPDFAKRVKAATERRLEHFLTAAKSGLMTLLKGKEYNEVTVERKVNKMTGEMEDCFEKVVTKMVMPNPSAVIFALKNLDPEHFNDTIRAELVNGRGEDGAAKPISVQIVAPVDDPLD